MNPRSLVLFAFLFSLSLPALARSPNRVFKGKIILSKKPFPFRFKSDKALIRHMKRVDSKSFRYDEEGNIHIEFMAFFARPHRSSQFNAAIYDVTERRRLVSTFPVYPNQKMTKILASDVVLDKETFPEERHYLLVISRQYNSPILAESKFAIKWPKGYRPPKIIPGTVNF